MVPFPAGTGDASWQLSHGGLQSLVQAVGGRAQLSKSLVYLNAKAQDWKTREETAPCLSRADFC